MNISWFSTAAICACLLTGCAASGPLYHEVKSSLIPEAGKGLAIVYFRPGGLGGANKFPIWANREVLTDKFRLGGFYTYQAAPGQLSLAVSREVGY